MTPPMKTAATTKHSSPLDALDQPAAKRGRHSKSKHTTTAEQKRKDKASAGRDIKEEDLTDSDQVEDSPSGSTGSDRSPKVDAEEEVKREPKEEDVKAEGTESGKPGSPKKEGDEQRVIEKGHAFFFYRPKMDIGKPSGASDVQKLYMLLSPDDAAGRPAAEDKVGQQDASSKPSHSKSSHRLLIIPQKSLPSPGGGRKSRIWAFVDEASTDLDKVEKRLDRFSYSTKTRGERTQESARLIAEARYDIVIHHGHSHFLYELEVPQQPGQVQEEFNILKQGQFLMQVKNPEIQSPATDRGQARYATLGKGAAKLPKHLQEKFRGIRKDWVRNTILDSTEFLDIPHVEVGFFAVNKDAKEEFAELMEALEAEIEEEGIEQEEKPEDHAYKELNLDDARVPAAVEEFK